MVVLPLLCWAMGCGRSAAARPSDDAGAAALAGHARPRALAVDQSGKWLYVALSTADRLAIIDVSGGRGRRVAEIPLCAFPDALSPLPGGGVVVGCRFDPGLRVVTPGPRPSPANAPSFSVRVVDAGPEHGNRGLAIDDAGRFAYVASPPRGGVKIVDLQRSGAPIRFLATGLSPQTVRWVSPALRPGTAGATGAKGLVLVANFIGHTVTVHDVQADGALSSALQTITTEAPVLDLAVVPASDRRDDDLAGQLLLATHEDRPLSRLRLAVEGLDSVVLHLRPSSPGGEVPFVDPGPGRRAAINLTERPREPLVGLDAVAVDRWTGRLAIAGAGTDNVVVARPRAESLLSSAAVTVGTHPSAVVFLPDGRLVTADRLSDTLSLVPPAGDPQTLTVGTPARPTAAEQGEVLFYGRALVPHNVATGTLSVYTCAACHADGHIDGRLHPSKRNRFFSTTQTCRGLAGTEPFLTLGKPATFAAFADNIVSTHAQGALDAPDTFDRYPVSLRLRTGGVWKSMTLSAEGMRAALAAYLMHIPVEPSPFVTSRFVASPLAPPGELPRLAASARRGLSTFRENCAGCHQLVTSAGASLAAVPVGRIEALLLAGQVTLTSAQLYDVGTPVLGDGGNNPPSLRGVWAAAPYFSDGSAASLEDVLRRTNPRSEKVHDADNSRAPAAFCSGAASDLLDFLRAL